MARRRGPSSVPNFTPIGAMCGEKPHNRPLSKLNDRHFAQCCRLTRLEGYCIVGHQADLNLYLRPCPDTANVCAERGPTLFSQPTNRCVGMLSAKEKRLIRLIHVLM